jgi:hypothetical protein
MAAAGQDKAHPYLNPHHVLHKEYGAYVGELFKLKATAPGADRSPLEKVMADGLALQQAKRDKVQQEAAELVEELNDLGIEGEVPENARPDQVESLKMEKLLAEEDFDALSPAIGNSLRALKVPSDIQQMFDTFSDADLDPELRSEIAGSVVKWIIQANERKHAQAGAKK